MVDIRMKPKRQIFARCGLLNAATNELDEAFNMLDVFCTLTIARGRSRVSVAFGSIKFVTADELCLQMARLDVSWDLVPLVREFHRP